MVLSRGVTWSDLCFFNFTLTAVWGVGCGEAVAEAMEAWSKRCQGGRKKVSRYRMCFGIGGK